MFCKKVTRVNYALTPALLWKHISHSIELSPYGRLIFDNTVLDQKHAKKIEKSQLQYSGNSHGLVQGIGVVTCVYHNPDCDKLGH